MKYCYNCKLYRPKDVMFCTLCGLSFDVKYCHKLHPNPVTAEYCGVCGSSDLSTPHKRPRRRGVGLIGAAAAGIVLVVASVWSIVSSLPSFDSIPSWQILLTLICCAGLTVIWTGFKRR
jgi:hypothetical protein